MQKNYIPAFALFSAGRGRHALMLMDFEKVLKELDYKKHLRSQANSIDKRLGQLQRELDSTLQIKPGLYTDL